MPKKVSLYNTATRGVEALTSVDQRIHMYCCGPTVYNFAHIGNLRTYIFEDVLKRTLLSAGFTVKHVMNITDVGHLVNDGDTGPDKMEEGAQREGRSVWDIADFYTKEFFANCRDLNIIPPDLTPKATDHISEMISMVQQLEQNGFTYQTDDGIYFDSAKFPEYCNFGKIDPETMDAGSRIAMGQKRNVTDFALWKKSPLDKKRHMEWESPWGIGFPGWHIECSAMALKYLRQPLDIHCGGTDHIKIHHTNEIAQVEAATGKQFCRVWMHGEWLVVDKAKMSKSKGNFITLQTVKDADIEPLAYRYYCLMAHYRSPLRYTMESLQSAAKGYSNLKSKVLDAKSCKSLLKQDLVDQMLAQFWSAVYDDLNMPKAFAVIWDLLTKENQFSGQVWHALVQADAILGLGLKELESPTHITQTYCEGKLTIISEKQMSVERTEKIIELYTARAVAKGKKDYTESDRIRKQLVELGVSLKDKATGATDAFVQDKT